jgi:hypothetical protein
VTYFAAALFFTLALLGAAVSLHMLVLQHWSEIVLALRGELGLSRPVRRTPQLGRPMPQRHAAF